MNEQSQQTTRIVKQHLNTFIMNLGIEAILTDYDENAVFITPEKVYMGKERIQEFFEDFIAALPEGARELFKLDSFQVNNDIAYITWRVMGKIPLGTDTFVIRDNKIVQQTFAMYPG